MLITIIYLHVNNLIILLIHNTLQTHKMESDFPRYTVDIERLVRDRNRLCLIAPADCRVRLNGVVWLTAGQKHGTGAAICRVVRSKGGLLGQLSDLAVDEGKDQIHALFEQTKRSMSWCFQRSETWREVNQKIL